MLAPIVLFVYNRSWHTRQTIEALQKNELAAESDLFIFADGPKTNATEICRLQIIQVRKYIHSIGGFKSVTIEEAPTNKGLANSVIAGVTKIINKYGKVIVVEDDIVSHPFFLRFMNDALDTYQKNSKIFVICATMEKFDFPRFYNKDVFLTYRMGSWGWATWKDRFDSINWDINTYPIIKNTTNKQISKLCRGGSDLWPMLQDQLYGRIDAWDILMQYNMSIQNKYSIRPVKSMVSNIGMDGTGIHCGNSNIQLLPLYDKDNYCIKLPDNPRENKAITRIIGPKTKLQNEIKYQKKKYYDWYVFHSFWMRRHRCRIQKPSNTILIIRIDAIGDSIIWLDQAKEYRKAFPNHKLVLLHNKAWSDIAKQMSWFDEYVSFDRTRINDKKYYLQLISQLNNYAFEKIFSPVFSRDFFTVDWLVHNINAKEKIGYDGDYLNCNGMIDHNIYIIKKYNSSDLKKIADNWYTKLVPNNNQCFMELQRNAHFVRQTIKPDFKCALPTIPFKIPMFDCIPKEEYAIFFLGASTTLRTWPVNKFHQIEQHIPYKKIILCGSSSDSILAHTYQSFGCSSDKTIIDLTGKTTLIELISVIHNASLIITNETSASHIAVATRTPSICLLGGGHFGRFHPYHVENISDEEKNYLPSVVTSHINNCFKCNWICKYPLQNSRWKCIDEIQIEDVIRTINEIIKRRDVI